MTFDTSAGRIAYVSELRPPARVHLSGICGTGMAAVARLFKERGFIVTGSDRAFYPPMGDVVKSIATELFTSYSADNFAVSPDLVVIGNSLRPDNPEAVFVREHSLPFAAMPEVFAGLLIGERSYCASSVVISGTHGKTTTSAAVAWLLECAGRKPGFFIGGVPLNLPVALRSVDTSLPVELRAVVLEGDEYDSAYFLKEPKFLSYRPDILVVTSIEFDHGDIYDSLEEIEGKFEKVVSLVPEDGVVLIGDAQERVCELGRHWAETSQNKKQFAFYGQKSGSDYRILSRQVREGGGQHLVFALEKGPLAAQTSLSGMHNAYNLLAAAIVAERLGVAQQHIASGIQSFSGVKRRQTVIGDSHGVTVIEDFAHHPTAVDVTLRGLVENYPGRRVIAVFEPRSNTSRRAFFQEEYAKSFSAASFVIFKSVTDSGGYSKKGGEIKPLDVEKLAKDISLSGVPAQVCAQTAEILDVLAQVVKTGDVVAFMSNGDFDSIQHRYFEMIAESGPR